MIKQRIKDHCASHYLLVLMEDTVVERPGLKITGIKVVNIRSDAALCFLQKKALMSLT